MEAGAEAVGAEVAAAAALFRNRTAEEEEEAASRTKFDAPFARNSAAAVGMSSVAVWVSSLKQQKWDQRQSLTRHL